MDRSAALRSALMVICLLAVALLLAGCEQSGGDPYQAGQMFREQVDLVLKDVGSFVAGFCSTAALPGLLALVAAWYGAQRSSR